MGYGSNLRYSRKNEVDEDQIRTIFREESKKIVELSRHNEVPRHYS